MTDTRFRPGRIPQAQDSFPAGEPELVESTIRNKNFRKRGHRQSTRKVAWDRKQFIAWDGEGTTVSPRERYLNMDAETSWPALPEEPQPYVMLAHSEGAIITDEGGLSTRECFEFILDTKRLYPDSIFVGFGFNYDVNQMLKDIPDEVLGRLYENGSCKWSNYWMQWRPRKSFIVTHKGSKRSAIIYDVFGFFQTSFLQTCKEYLGDDDPDLEYIAKGKEARDSFKWEEMDDFIIPYNNRELSMLVRVMNQLRQDLHEVGIDPSRWHGPGAIADEVLRKYNIPIDRTAPEEVLDAAQYAYAGGRFEHFGVGRYVGPVYEYDIHSAYPAAAFQLPDICDGFWEYVESFEPESFGVWNIDYRAGDRGDGYRKPQPLFCRSQDGSISYPVEVRGWYWTPEARLVPDFVTSGWVFRPSSDRKPFAFVAELYDERRILKAQGKSAQRALKLILNSLYGKMAQTVGGRKGQPPRWHQLEYAGYITSYTRAMIYKAVSINPAAIIAVETDAVFSTEPLPLPCTDDLGDWEAKEYTEIVYLQSGFYYATKRSEEIVCKYRGMDRDRDTKQPVGLPYREVLDSLARRTGPNYRFTPGLRTYTTRFIGLGMARKTSSVWCSWEKERKRVSIDQKPWSSKRYHLSEECPECGQGRTMNDCLHTMLIGGYAGHSYARKLPWRHINEEKEVSTWHEAPESWEEWQEMSDEYLVLEEADRWS